MTGLWQGGSANSLSVNHSTAMVPTRVKSAFYGGLKPVTRALHQLGVHPNSITVFGLILAGLCAYAISLGAFLAAALLLVVSGLCDMADGEVARLRGIKAKAGAFLDSTLDRYGEIVVFGGLLVFFLNRLPRRSDVVVVILFAVTGSLMVSYARARAEGLGMKAGKALLERPERLVLLIGGLLWAAGGGPLKMVPVLYLLAVGTHLGAVQRIYRQWMQMQVAAKVRQ